ncbi:peptidylprolyl isomerase [Helicobacter saguini]|uniref:Peptidylprolyl isomerase n=1 Tax=Helicobacter saguini TaxID=1548018 RepID=A0A347VN81_9HELI|nr:peptidylprolyl isomerase [Helicobacter saguini]MWV61868.1 peptidylprolyl isomerase [Helicobacter saguini]MWV67457.1 peptidylprolyl isomerase [Helicobacter saguini]MWV69809.1 peptidylprolyl isomerase [Helicobacter saguini]MWV72973.1 peptidylprolyl isomerase [Helicobacter saguini]TLD95646.1 peptidylprolyl isomerase [Helicobacter saguini]
MGNSKKAIFGKIFLCAGFAFSSILSAKVLVNVDGTEISDSVFAPIKQQNPSFNYDALPQQQKDALLDELIAGALMANAAKREGLDKSEEYKMANLQLLSQLWLKKQGESIGKTINVTEQEAKAFYDNPQNKQMFVSQNASVRHILVAKEDQAKNIIAEIAKVPKTKTEDKVAELAKKFSLDEASKANGGLMENLPIGQTAPEFAAAVKGMTAGTYSKTPVKTQFGYHIIYLKKLDAPTTLTFDKVKPQLIEALRQEKMQGILQEKLRKMRDTAKITYGAGK